MLRKPAVGLYEPRELDPGFSHYKYLSAFFDFQRDTVPVNQINGDPMTLTGSGAVVRTSQGKKGTGSKFGATDGSTYMTWPVGAELPGSACYVWCGQIPATGGTDIVWRDNTTVNGTILAWRNAGNFDMRLGNTDFTAAGTFDYLVDQTIVINVIGTASSKLFANGALVINGGAPGVGSIVTPWTIHKNGGNAQGTTAVTKLIAVFHTPIPDSLALQLSSNPLLMTRPVERFVFPAQAASSGTSVTLEPFAGTVNWNGQLATIKTRVNVAPSVGNVAWNGGVPTYSYQRTTVSPASGTITWNGGVPTLKTLQRISPLAGTVVWNGQLPTLATRVSVTIQPLSGTVSWNGGVVTQKLRINVSPAAGAVSWAGGVATQSFPANFAWTAVDRASTSWTKIARTTASWSRIDRSSTTWVKRTFPYDDEV